MATAAVAVMAISRRPRRRNPKPHFVVVHGGRELEPEHGQALLLNLGAKMDIRLTNARLDRLERRSCDVPERMSVGKAMLAVEERLVKAFWTIARQPLGASAPGSDRRCGLDYIHERGETAGYRDAAGGDWSSTAPRPSLPSSREIDQANEALDWLLLIHDERLRRLLVVGATSKRGDVARNISWPRIRLVMPGLTGLSDRTLRHRYSQSIRTIVTELTLAKMARE